MYSVLEFTRIEITTRVNLPRTCKKKRREERKEFRKPGNYYSKAGGWKYSPKTGVFQPTREGWNL